MNPLHELRAYGQSIWLDYIRRSLITSGELQRLVEEDGLRGVTSNPTIFQKAIAGSTDYDAALRALLEAEPHADARALYEALAIEDIRMAADVLRPIYDATVGSEPRSASGVASPPQGEAGGTPLRSVPDYEPDATVGSEPRSASGVASSQGGRGGTPLALRGSLPTVASGS